MKRTPTGEQRLRIADKRVTVSDRTRRTRNERPVKRRTQANRSEETRGRLLDAAIKVIAKRGFLGFTTQEAARAARLTRGAPLHHFRTTEEYLRAALGRIFAIDLQATQRVIASLTRNDDLVEAMAADARNYFFGSHFVVALDVLISSGSTGRLNQEVRELAARYRSPVEALWQSALIARGVPTNVAEDVVWLVMSIVRGLAIRTSFKHDPARIDRTIAVGIELVREMLAHKLGRNVLPGRPSSLPAGGTRKRRVPTDTRF